MSPGSHKRLSEVQVPEPPTIVPLHPITFGVTDATDLTTNLVFITWNLGKVTSYLMAPKTGHWHKSPGISHIYPKSCDKVLFKSTVQEPQLWASQSLVLLVLVRTDLRTALWASHTIRTQRSLRTQESVLTVKMSLALVTHCSLDDQVLRDTADIKQSQRNQSQRRHTFKLLSRAKAPANSISHLNGGKMFSRSTGNKNKGYEIDYFKIRFLSGSMDATDLRRDAIPQKGWHMLLKLII